MPNKETQQEVDRNYSAFKAKQPKLLPSHRGKFALMHDAQVEAFFDTFRDAFTSGRKLHSDGMFSVQEVSESPIDLGFFSHAVD